MLENKYQVKAYLEIVHAQFFSHNIYERCLKLTEMGISQGVHALLKEADHLNHQVTIIVLQAERKNTRKNYGYGWSPKLAEAGQEVTFWKNCVRCFRQGVHPTTQNVTTYMQKVWHTEPEEGTEILPK